MTTDQLRTNLIQSYNRQAEQRNKGEIEDWKAKERAAFLTLLQSEEKQTLLEIGAGHGRDSTFFQENGLQVTCIDLSTEMVKLSQQKGLSAGLMDIVHLGLLDTSFEAIYALNSMLHLPKKELPAALQNIRRILKPNGLFFLGVYGGYDFEGIWEEDSYTPKRFFALYSDQKLKQVATESFKLVSVKQIPLEDTKMHF